MPYVDLDSVSPSNFPTTEDDTWEFKSSRTPPSELKKKLCCAASVFANSGGGVFVWGVEDSTGAPDGGVDQQIGRENVADWLDKAVCDVAPIPAHRIKLFTDSEGRGTLGSGLAIAAISIAPSNVGPHQASDKRYYIRAGSRTVAAGHFLVEAIWAKRQVTKPIICHVLRKSTTSPYGVQLGLICVTDAPAFDVRLSISPLPRLLEIVKDRFPIQIPVIDRSTPFFMDIATTGPSLKELTDDTELYVEYKDLTGSQFTYKNATPIRSGFPPINFLDDSIQRLAKSLEALANRPPILPSR